MEAVAVEFWAEGLREDRERGRREGSFCLVLERGRAFSAAVIFLLFFSVCLSVSAAFVGLLFFSRIFFLSCLVLHFFEGYVGGVRGSS